MSHTVRSNSAPKESFAKLRSNCGLHNELDIHGMYWSERTILEVHAFDRTAGKVVVKNENGFTWISDLKAMEFCKKDGSKIYNQ